MEQSKVEELDCFFASLNIPESVRSRYVESCSAQFVSLDVLFELREDQLEKIGILLGHRVMIMKRMEPSTIKHSEDALDTLFVKHRYSKPQNLVDAMLIIGVLLTKLDMDAGILAAVYGRSVLKDFKYRYLFRYIPAQGKKTSETLKAAYISFHSDKINPVAKHIKNCIKLSSTDFAETCLKLYKRSSDIIHMAVEVYYKYRTLGEIQALLGNIPEPDENDQAILAAIYTSPKPGDTQVWGGIDFKDYYRDADPK